MMDMWSLPTSLEVGGVGYAIETDFRRVLYALSVLSDPDYEPDEQAAVFLGVMFPAWETIPEERFQEALEKAMEFIDAGITDDGKRRRPRTVDWEQDAPIIVPAVNKVLGREIRALPYLHWWTFLGAYMEIGEGLFSTVLGIRQKRAKGKKLEKYEAEFVRENKSLVTLRKRLTPEEQARRDALKRLFV